MALALRMEENVLIETVRCLSCQKRGWTLFLGDGQNYCKFSEIIWKMEMKKCQAHLCNQMTLKTAGWMDIFKLCFRVNSKTVDLNWNCWKNISISFYLSIFLCSLKHKFHANHHAKLVLVILRHQWLELRNAFFGRNSRYRSAKTLLLRFLALTELKAIIYEIGLRNNS